ncbi:MAG: substrate-binding domain-containing protein [Planctomycetota bacterium]
MPTSAIPKPIVGHPQVFVSVGLGFGYARDIVAGIVAYAREHGPWEFVGQVGPGTQRDAIKPPAAYDGVIFQRLPPRTLGTIRRRGLPAVSVGGGAIDADIHHVTSDGQAIADMAYRYFLNLGFKRFAAYGGSPRGRATMVETLRDLAEADGSSFTDLGPAVRRPEPGHPRVLSWAQELNRLKTRLPKLEQRTALLTCSTEDARPVVAACDELGINVPDEIAVLGVDDDEAICELASPPISSIDHGCEQMGWEAAQQLDLLMHGQHPARRLTQIAPLRVVSRQSTNTLAIDDPLVVRTLSILQTRFEECLTVKTLIDELAVSRPTLEAHFRKTLGHTVHRHLTTIRIQHAKELLQSTTLNMADISARCGFSYPSKLSSIFLREVGLSPREYRLRYQIRRKI